MDDIEIHDWIQPLKFGLGPDDLVIIKYKIGSCMRHEGLLRSMEEFFHPNKVMVCAVMDMDDIEFMVGKRNIRNKKK